MAKETREDEWARAYSTVRSSSAPNPVANKDTLEGILTTSRKSTSLKSEWENAYNEVRSPVLSPTVAKTPPPTPNFFQKVGGGIAGIFGANKEPAVLGPDDKVKAPVSVGAPPPVQAPPRQPIIPTPPRRKPIIQISRPRNLQEIIAEAAAKPTIGMGDLRATEAQFPQGAPPDKNLWERYKEGSELRQEAAREKYGRPVVEQIEDSPLYRTLIGDPEKYPLGQMVSDTMMATVIGRPAAVAKQAVTKGGSAALSVVDKVKRVQGFFQKRPLVGAATAATVGTGGGQMYRGASDPAQSEDNMLTQAGAGLRAGTGQTIELIGQAQKWQGREEVGERLIQMGEKMSEGFQLDPHEYSTFRKAVRDPRFWTVNVANAIPTTLSLIPAMYVGYRAGKSTGQVMGFNQYWSTITGAFAGSLASRPLEAMLEAGDAFAEAQEMGRPFEESQAIGKKVFDHNMALMAVDGLQLAVYLMPLPGLSKFGKIGKAASLTGRVGFGAFTEGKEESYQEAVQQLFLGLDERSIWEQLKNPTVRQQEAEAIGAIFGMVMGGSGEIVSRLRQGPDAFGDTPAGTLPPKERKFLWERFKFHAKKGLPQEAAIIEAVDDLAKTPAGQKLLQEASQKAAGAPQTSPVGIDTAPAAVATGVAGQVAPVAGRPQLSAEEIEAARKTLAQEFGTVGQQGAPAPAGQVAAGQVEAPAGTDWLLTQESVPFKGGVYSVVSHKNLDASQLDLELDVLELKLAKNGKIKPADLDNTQIFLADTAGYYAIKEAFASHPAEAIRYVREQLAEQAAGRVEAPGVGVEPSPAPVVPEARAGGVTEPAGSPVSFTTFDEAQAWIDAKAKEYGGKNKFLASEEYKEVNPVIQKLYAQMIDKYRAGAEQAMQEVGVTFGDRVRWDYVTPFGVTEYTGKIVSRNGVPYVKFDEGLTTTTGEKSARWHKGFTPETKTVDVAPKPPAPKPESAGKESWEMTEAEREATTAGRRKDFALRTEIDKLSPEEKDEVIKDLREHYFKDELTGLKNRAAYLMDEKQPYQAVLDLDNLKWVNDNIGHGAGDTLIKALANELPDNAYHLSGDEFIIQGRSEKELKALLSGIESRLSEQAIELAGDQRTVVKRGIGFGYGIGETLGKAETALQQHKKARLEEGKRVARGETPAGIVDAKAEAPAKTRPPAAEKPPVEPKAPVKEPGRMPPEEVNKLTTERWATKLAALDKEVVERRDDIIRWAKNQAIMNGAPVPTPEKAIDDHYGKFVAGTGFDQRIPLKRGETWRDRLVKMADGEAVRRAIFEGKPVPEALLKKHPRMVSAAKTLLQEYLDSAKAAKPEPAREPWQMTLLEYAKSELIKANRPGVAAQLTSEEQAKSYRAQYIKDLQGWQREGKIIPEAVIAKYPELKPAPAKPEPKPAEKPEPKATAPESKLPIAVSPDDVPYQLAYEAYRNSSFSPEKAARREQDDYVRDIESQYERLAPMAKTEEQKALLIEELTKYRDGYLKHHSALLQAQGRTMSPMITGPAKFPVARNQKALGVVDKRMKEFLEWRDKAQAAMKRKLTPDELKPVSSDQENAVEILEKKIAKAEALQDAMRRGNAIIRDKKLTDAQKIEKLTTELGFKEETARKALQPDYMGRLGFAPFELQNNNANIKRMKERVETLKKQRADETTEITFDGHGGGQIIDSVDANRVQVIFNDEAEGKAMRAQFKARGFVWAPSQDAYQRKRSADALYWAKEIVGAGKAVEQGAKTETPGAKVKEPWEMSREAYEASAEPNKLPSEYDALDTIYKMRNGQAYNPNLITENAVAALRAQRLVSGAKQAKITPAGLSTHAEWSRLAEENRLARGDAGDRHYEIVERAVVEGKSVPEEALKDYPILAAKAKNLAPATETGATPAKEPWEMSREEYTKELAKRVEQAKADEARILAQVKKDKKTGWTASVSLQSARRDLKNWEAALELQKADHEGAVRQALSEGKHVPPEVLKEYGLDKEPGAKVERRDPATKNPAPLLVGKIATAKTERGTAVKVQYAVVEAETLVTSHTVDMKVNPDYPAELQPRDRSRAASQEQISRIAKGLDPDFLGESPKASEGAPIVGQDMIVESGNARTIAIHTAYGKGLESVAGYKKWLVENAEKFGLDAKMLEGVERPVLVRVRQSEIDRVQFTQEANEQSVAAMSASEQAMADAKNLKLDEFVPSESGEVIHAANRDFVRHFMKDIVGTAERGRYVTDDGSISQEGVARIRNAVFAKAYGDVAAIQKLAESTDNNVRNITNAMLAAAPRIAKLKDGVAKGSLYDLDISPEIAAAANKLSALREQGLPVQRYLKQQQMFGEDLSPLAREILDVFDTHSRSAKKLSAILHAYADTIFAMGNPKQEAIFAESKKVTREQVWTMAVRKVEKDEVVQPTLFQSPASAPAQAVRKTAQGVREEASRREKVDERKTDDRARQAEKGAAAQIEKLAGQEVQVKVVKPATPFERDLVTVGEALGVDVLFYESNTPIGEQGIVQPEMPDILMLRKHPDADLSWTLGHEFMHHLEIKHPDLYKAIYEVVDESITEKQIDDYLTLIPNEKLRKEYKENRETVLGEIISDESGNLFNQPTFWQKLYDKSPELFKRVADAITRFFKSVSGKDYETFLTKKQINNVRQEIQRAIIEVRRRGAAGSRAINEDAAKFAARRLPERYFEAEVQLWGKGEVITRRVQAKDHRDAAKRSAMLEPGQITIVDGGGLKVSFRTDKNGVPREIAAYQYGRRLAAREMRERLAVPTFYSKLQAVLIQKMPPRATKEQVQAIILKGGVKADEVKWSGIIPWLDEQGAMVTKREVLDFVQNAQVEIEEEVKGDLSRGNNVKGTKYSMYALPGGRSGYAEMLMTIPWRESKLKKADVAWKEEAGAFEEDGEATAWVAYVGDKQIEGYAVEFNVPNETYEAFVEDAWVKDFNTLWEAQEYLNEKIDTEIREAGIDDDKYRSSHWDEPNVLVHARYTDRTDKDGKRTLLVEEVQSDWHQEGRRKGYKSKNPLTDKAYERIRDNARAALERNDYLGYSTIVQALQAVREDLDFPMWQLTASQDINALIEYREAIDSGGVPDAPFRKTWHELAMKRMIRFAAENDFERIAWTTGEQQAERYNLSKQVGSVQAYRNYKDGNPVESYQFYVVDPQGKTIDSLTRGSATREQIVETFGKDLGVRLIEGADKAKGQRFEVSGDGLKIGGEGMRGFYDKMLPTFIGKYVKQWGVKVGETSIVTGRDWDRSAYEGPTYTVEELKAFLKENRQYPVAVESDLRALIGDMVGGQPFLDAVRRGSVAMARALGGEIVAPRSLEKLHAVDVTPAMRESVLYEGQPLFSSRVMTERGQAKPGDVSALADKGKPKATSVRTAEEVLSRLSPKASREISERLAKALETVMRAGRVQRQARGALGTFSKKAGTGRIKKSKVDNWRVVGHELGHALQFNAGFEPDAGEMAKIAKLFYPRKITGDKRTSEGLAEFLALWFSDNAKARELAPKTTELLTDFLDGNPELKAAFSEALTIALNDLEGSSLQQIGNDIMRPNERHQVNVGAEYEVPKHKRLTFQVADLTIPLRDLHSAAVAQGYQDMNPAILAAIMGMERETAIDMFQNRPRFKSGQFIVPEQERTFKELVDAADAAYPGGIEIMDRVYHAMRYKERFDEVDARRREIRKKAALEGKHVDEKDLPRHFDAPRPRAFYENAVKEARVQFPEIVKLVEVYSETLSETILRYLVAQEVISANTAERVRAGSKYYLPLYHTGKVSAAGAESNARRSAGQPVQRYKGHSGATMPFLEATMVKLTETVQAGEINRLMHTIEKALKQDNMGLFGEIVDRPVVTRAIGAKELEVQLEKAADFLGPLDVNDEARVIRLFMVGGMHDVSKAEPILMARHGDKQTYMRVAPDIYQAVGALKPIAIDLIAKVFTYISQVGRFGALANVRFLTNAFVRDVIGANVQSQTPERSMLWGFIKGAGKSAGLDPELMSLYIQSGAYGSSVQEGLNSLMRSSYSGGLISTSVPGWKRTVSGVFVRVAKTPWEVLRVAEEASRVSEFEAVLKKKLKPLGLTIDDLKQGNIPEGAAKEVEAILVEAAYASREVIVNFSLHGIHEGFTKYARTVPFMRAGTNGVYRGYRQVKDRPLHTLKQWSIYLLPITLICWLTMKDDDRFRDMPSDSRDRYWWLPAGPYLIALAKPYEYAFPANMLERYMDWVYMTDDPNRRKPLEEALGAMKESFGVPTLSMLTDAVIGLMRNKSHFGSPITPMREEGLDPELQYGPGSTKAAIKMAEIAAGFMGEKTPSPRQIDYFMNTALAGIGKTTMAGLSAIVGAASPDTPGSEKRAGIEYAPVIGSLIYGPGQGGSRITDTFYNDYDRAQQKWKSHGQRLARDIDPKMTEKDLRLVQMIPAMRWIANDLAELRGAIRELEISKTATPEQKRRASLYLGWYSKMAAGYLYGRPVPKPPAELGLTEAHIQDALDNLEHETQQAMIRAAKTPGGPV